MPTMDSTAKAALDLSVIAPAFFIFLDIAGDPIRITTGPADVTLASTGDSQLDGTYSAADPRVISVSEVQFSEGGSDTVTISLSGLVTIDTTLLNEIGDTTKWMGRTCRLWMQIYDGGGTAQGAIFPYYTGYAVGVEIIPSPQSQQIRLRVENYLSAFSKASGRDYLNAADYDSSDTSAAATLAAANNARGAAGAAVGGGGGSFGFGDGGGGLFERQIDSQP